MFLQGMYAGLLCLRHPKDTTTTTPMPWPKRYLGLFPGCRPSPKSLSSSLEGEETGWARTATKQSILLLVLTLVVGAGDTALRVFTGMAGLLGGNVWLQGIVAFGQLEVSELLGLELGLGL